LGPIQVNEEQCKGGFLPTQINTPQSTKLSKVELSVAGGGELLQGILPIDLVLAIDSSGSMRINEPTNLRLSAAKAFLDKLNPATDMASVVSWDDGIDFTFPLTRLDEINATGDSIKSSIDKIDSTGGRI
jgi:secreted protein with Ig-like and vWFA domain